jgi:hypothetical protein
LISFIEHSLSQGFLGGSGDVAEDRVAKNASHSEAESFVGNQATCELSKIHIVLYNDVLGRKSTVSKGLGSVEDG